jgi:hypothetical protein
MRPFAKPVIPTKQGVISAAQQAINFTSATVARRNFLDLFGWTGTVSPNPTSGAVRMWFDQSTNEVQAIDANGNPVGFTAGSLPSLIFTRGGTILTPTGAVNVIVWYAPFAATVTNVLGYVSGATGSVINARRNGSLLLLDSNLTVGTADTWVDGGAVQNTAISVGDKLEIMVISVSGSPTEIAVEIQCTRP